MLSMASAWPALTISAKSGGKPRQRQRIEESEESEKAKINNQRQLSGEANAGAIAKEIAAAAKLA